MICVAVFHRNLLFASAGGFLKMEVVCFFRILSLQQKSGSLANGTIQSRRMCLIIKVGFLLLSMLSFKVRYHSLNHHCHAELHFNQQTVADWSQFCSKAILVFIWVFPYSLFLGWGTGRGEGRLAKLWK